MYQQVVTQLSPPAAPACCVQGPCNEPKPWGWSVVNNAKWQSWKQLGDMPAGM